MMAVEFSTTPERPETASFDAERAAFSIFAFLWAASILFHMMSYSERLGPLRLLLAATAFLVLWSPSATWRLLAAAALHLVYFWRMLPYTPNHGFVAAAAELILLGAAAAVILSRRRLTIDGEEIYRRAAPMIRLSLLVLYFFVVFHKLNAGFFDLAASCSAFMYGRVAAEYPWMPDAAVIRTMAIYSTIVIEAAIPIMLLFGPLRLAGFVVAFVFHFLLAMDPGEVVYNFTSMLLALFALFAPPAFSAELVRQLAAVRRAIFGWSAGPFVLRAVGYVGLPLLVGAIIFRRDLSTGFTGETGRALWVLYALALMVIFIAAVRRTSATQGPGAGALLTTPTPALLAVPLLLAMNGAMPYLGAKTDTAFAMFSNLRTEGGVTNHYLVPASAQMFGYQRDLVVVKSSSDAQLQRLASQESAMVFFEFRRAAQRNPGASVVYERGGQTVSVPRIGEVPELMARPNVLMSKLMLFRTIPSDTNDMRCLH